MSVPRSLLRRSALLATLATAVALALAACGGGSSSGGSAQSNGGSGSSAGLEKTLHVGWYGGPIGDAFDKVVVKPFEKATGVNVTVETGFDDARLSQLRSDPGSLDVAFFTAPIMPDVRKAGVTTPITTAQVPRLADVYPSLRSSDAFGWSFGVWGIAYNADKVKPAPTSWADLLNHAYKGHVTGPDITFNSSILTLDAFARLGGGDLTHLAPGFTRMQQLRGNSPFFWASDSQMLPQLEGGSIWMSAYANGGTYLAAKAAGAQPIKFAIPKEGGYSVPFDLVIAKGAKSPRAAAAFANFLLSPKVQLAWAKAIYYSPANDKVNPPASLKGKILSGSAVDRLKQVNWTQFSQERAQVVERWQSQIH